MTPEELASQILDWFLKTPKGSTKTYDLTPYAPGTLISAVFSRFAEGVPEDRLVELPLIRWETKFPFQNEYIQQWVKDAASRPEVTLNIEGDGRVAYAAGSHPQKWGVFFHLQQGGQAQVRVSVEGVTVLTFSLVNYEKPENLIAEATSICTRFLGDRFSA